MSDDETQDIADEEAIIEDLEQPTVDEPQFGMGAVAEGADDPLVEESVDEWLEGISFESTEDVPIPERLVDQVIGQEDAAVVIRKAAEQRRHMLMIGDPGTGKSMLAKAMTELMPLDSMEDIMCYPNDDDDNEADNEDSGDENY